MAPSFVTVDFKYNKRRLKSKAADGEFEVILRSPQHKKSAPSGACPIKKK
jgi:hypothetical protein